MIRAEHFVESARGLGFDFYTGVPCSYLTPFINTVIENERTRYVSSANEGDAVATAAGAVLGGRRAVAMMQNSGLGNAVSPLSSLTWVFRIPVLLVVTLRGDPELGDEPQHQLMGAVTTRILETLEIPWRTFPSEPEQVEPALRQANEHLEKEARPFALVMRKGAVAPRALGARCLETRPPGWGRYESHASDGSARGLPSRRQALARIAAASPVDSSVLVATTGFTGRELYALEDRPNQLYMVGSMGCASSLGLGLSLARPGLRVVVVDGDGSALMRLGNLATLGAYGGDDLVHVVLDNECHDSTGGQSTVSAGVSFARIGHGCGYGLALEGRRLELLDTLFETPGVGGPRLLHLKIQPGTEGELPRPDVSPQQVRARLEHHLREMAFGADA